MEKKLGCGQFGVVKQGILFRGKNESEVFAVKILKGINFCTIIFIKDVLSYILSSFRDLFDQL